MNSFLVALIIFLAPGFAIAQSTSQQGELHLGNPGGAKAVDKILKSLEGRDSWDLFAVSNGSHLVFEFDAKNFTEAAATKALDESLSNTENECRYETEVGLPVWELLKKTELDSAFEQPEGMKIIKKLEATGETLFIGARRWDESSGDSEYCMKYYYTMYFKNDKAISIDYDLTD